MAVGNQLASRLPASNLGRGTARARAADRHKWLGPLLLCATLGAILGPTSAPSGSSTEDVSAFAPGARVLFQGDSITDGARGRSADPNHILGHGYVFIIAARFGAAYPERHLTFVNRGVSGNTVSDLAGRWKSDAIDVKPDLLSIMVGVNDLNGGVSVEQFAERYDRLLADTRKALPDVRLVLCEPFGLPVGSKQQHWEAYHADLAKRQAVVADLAAKYHAPLVKLQRVFDRACDRAPASYWIWDGIHPTYAGHQLMADEWVRTVRAAWG